MDSTTLAKEVLALMASEGMNLSENVTEIEPLIREMVLELGAKAVELHLAGKKLGYEGSSRPCDNPDCKCNQKFIGYRPRTLAGLMGQFTFLRAYYHCETCGCSCCPYDQAAGLGKGQESVPLAKAAALVAAMDPFIPAATLLHELSGQKLGDRTVHRLARKVGAAASERETRLALGMATWSIADERVLARPARLYVAVDGVFVHRSDWHEARCATCWWEETDGRGNVTRRAQYMVRFAKAEDFRAYVWSLAMRCGLDSATEVVLLGDGAAWIWEHIAPILGQGVVCITDWYHVMEHVWACGNALFGQGGDEASAWVKQRETMLWEGKYLALLEDLQSQRKQMRSPGKREALRSLCVYLEHQGNRLDYAKFKASGYDIGSGRVESACKFVVAGRMKRSGMIWSDEGAQEVLSLRTAYLNEQWEQLWAAKPLLAKKAA